MAGSTTPFRRLTNPLLVPVTTSPTADNALIVPANFIPPGATSFCVVNSNLCWVRLMGTGGGASAPVAVQDYQGWLFPPGFFGVFSTQLPIWMSAGAFARDGYPLAGLTLQPLEVSYGEGT